MEIFPEFAEEGHAKLIKLDEDSQKSPDGKEKWRKFIAKYVLLPCALWIRWLSGPTRYEKIIKDYNFGSLLRVNSKDEYSETNTIFGARFSSFFALY